MADKTVYDLFLELGMPPEKIMQLLQKHKASGQQLFGGNNAAGGLQMSEMRGGQGNAFASPARVSSKLSYMQ